MIDITENQVQQRPLASSSTKVFFSAPHRVMFFAGSLQLILPLLFWSLELLGRYTNLWNPLPLEFYSTWAHGFLMIYAIYIFFIFGFLMTTFPKWLMTEPVLSRYYLTSFALMFTGLLAFYNGLIFSPYLLIAGIYLIAAGWGTGLYALVDIYIRAGKERTIYETVMLISLCAGLLGLITSLGWINHSYAYIFQVSNIIGIWFFLLPLVVTVCHRMIPFFGSCALDNYTIKRPQWSLLLLLGCLYLRGLLLIFSLQGWMLIPDFLLMLTGFYLLYTWEIQRSFKVPLLAMLHISFLWFPVSMLIFTLQDIIWLFTDQYLFGRAPVHAIGIGFITSMILAMVSRVTLGHSGRALTASRLTILCFGGLQLVTLFRVMAEFSLVIVIKPYNWNLLAAIAWLACLLIWCWKYVPIYLTPRADGKPG